jgi:uncharacterized membrane protein YbhN (UPF0104 family)
LILNNLFLKSRKSNSATVKILKIIGYILTIASIAYITWIGYNQWQKIIESFSISRNWPVILFSILIYSVSYTIIVLGWKNLINGFGGYLTFKNSYIICGQSQMAKYIPGNIFHYVGRLILSKKAGLPNSIIINSVFFEAVILVVVSVILALFYSMILGWQNVLLININRLLVISIIVLASISVILICIRFIPRFKSWLVKNNLLIDLKTIDLKSFLSTIFLVSVIYTIFFMILGLNLWFISNYLWSIDLNLILIFIGSYAISWAAGLITPGAPGGIGVREAVLIAILSPYLNEVRALTLALVFRIITILGDALFFSTTYLFKIKFKKKTGS